jgi:hypothetical protein
MNRKLTAMFATMLIALCLAGLSYAMWSKTLYIDGTVKTGEVDVEFLVDPYYEYTGLTYKYYDGSWDKTGENDPDWFHGSQGPDYGTNTLGSPVGTTARLDKDVGKTSYTLVDTDSDGDIDKIVVTVTNAYPGYVGGITYRIHNCGSIPVRYKITVDEADDALFVCTIDADEGAQLEHSEFRKIGTGFVVAYEADWGYDAAEGAIYHFTIEYEAVQWNEYTS